jgi:hypothetical protein
MWEGSARRGRLSGGKRKENWATKLPVGLLLSLEEKDSAKEDLQSGGPLCRALGADRVIFDCSQSGIDVGLHISDAQSTVL